MIWGAYRDLRSDGISRKGILKITTAAVAASALPKMPMTFHDGQLLYHGVALSRENNKETYTA
jgi:hypothetical protein